MSSDLCYAVIRAFGFNKGEESSCKTKFDSAMADWKQKNNCTDAEVEVLSPKIHIAGVSQPQRFISAEGQIESTNALTAAERRS